MCLGRNPYANQQSTTTRETARGSDAAQKRNRNDQSLSDALARANEQRRADAQRRSGPQIED